MDKSYPAKPDLSSSTPHTCSPATLIDSGLRYMQDRQYSKALACFEEGSRHFANQQSSLAATLDTFLHAHTLLEQVREKLFHAIRQFSQAENDLETQMRMLEQQLQAHLRGCDEPPMSLPSSESSPLSQQVEESTCGQQRKNSRRLLAEQESSPLQHKLAHASNELPALDITCFGRFEVRRQGNIVELCSSRSGQSILRYLVARRKHHTTIDTLITMLWPDDEPEVAQHKLHISISALRRSLNQDYPCEPRNGYIICKNHGYSLNAAIEIRTDVDAFLDHYQAGQGHADMRVYHYEQACQLYTGPFLEEDLYADWSYLQREQLKQIYLTMGRALADHYLSEKRYEDAQKWCALLLGEDQCDEITHRLLIHIYVAQGRRSEALQQYQHCQRILHEEMGVAPMPETTRIVQSFLS